MKRLVKFIPMMFLAVTLHAQTAPYACSANQFVNSILANTGQSCGAPSTAIPVIGLNWQLTPGLFATSTVVGPIYYTPESTTTQVEVVNITGSLTCASNPVLKILDLGTSPTTIYASATAVGSAITITGNGIFTFSGAGAIAAGHYIGIGFSAGTCITPPTVNVSLTLQ